MFKKIVNIIIILFVFILTTGIFAYLTLKLIIKSEDTVIVPYLLSKDVVYALEILDKHDLNLKLKGTEYHPSIPKAHIIIQEPEPGDVIKKGRDVKVYISKGTKNILVPNIEGLALNQAKLILENNNICVNNYSYTTTENYKKNYIISQYPASGKLFQRGNCMDLLISIGSRPKAYNMSNLIGFSLDEAINFIEKNNLVLGEILTKHDINLMQNIVIQQNPVKGERIIEGNKVNLVISRISDNNKNLNILNGCKLFKYRIKNGLLRVHIRVRINIFGLSYDLLNDFKNPGEEIWIIIPNNKDTSILLYEDDELIITKIFDSY